MGRKKVGPGGLKSGILHWPEIYHMPPSPANTCWWKSKWCHCLLNISHLQSWKKWFLWLHTPHGLIAVRRTKVKLSLFSLLSVKLWKRQEELFWSLPLNLCSPWPMWLLLHMSHRILEIIFPKDLEITGFRKYRKNVEKTEQMLPNNTVRKREKW